MAKSNLAEKLKSPEEEEVAKRTLSANKNKEARGQVIPFRPARRPRVSNATEEVGNQGGEIIPFMPEESAQEPGTPEEAAPEETSAEEEAENMAETVEPEQEEETSRGLESEQNEARQQEEAAEEEKEETESKEKTQAEMAAPPEEGEVPSKEAAKPEGGEKEEEKEAAKPEAATVPQEEQADKGRQMTAEKTKESNKQPPAKKPEEGDPSLKFMQKATDRALIWSIQNLVDSWGLTLIYINFHFIAHYFAGWQSFTKFGKGGLIALLDAMGYSAEAEEMAKVGELTENETEILLITALGLTDANIIISVIMVIIAALLPIIAAYAAIAAIVSMFSGT